MAPAKVYRKVGLLSKMVEAAINGDVEWSQVLHYLDSHTHKGDTERSLDYEAPFPANAIPTLELRRELWYDEHGNSLLRRAVLKLAPVKIIAAICQLCPETLSKPDNKGRLPLHQACRIPPSEDQDLVVQLLIQAHREALIHRDSGGRTPLHYFFWYHAKMRTSITLKYFIQKLPKHLFYSLQQYPDSNKQHALPGICRPSAQTKITNTAAIVPDARHGCLPLHYAVMGGASLPLITLLLDVYPFGKHACDRYGRTPLHWYLGAAYLVENNTSHVSGEAMDPNQPVWYTQAVDSDTLRLLLSSQVARTADALGRCPLHWAAHFWACQFYDSDQATMQGLTLAHIKMIVDHHIGQLVSRDSLGMTPLMVLFDSTARLRLRDYKLERVEQQSSNNKTTDQLLPAPFSAPLECVQMLLDFPDADAYKVASLEDAEGRLPIHAALGVAADVTIIEALVQAHPMSLLHTTEEGLQVPLHSAFAYPHTAPLQCEDVVEVLVQAMDVSKHGTHVDGRIAMKMEDSTGYFPIHYACQNRASPEVIEFMVKRYPQTARSQLPNGSLPIHCLVSDSLIETAIRGVKNIGTPEREQFDATRRKMRSLLQPLLSDSNKLQVAEACYGLLPIHIAVLFEAASYSMLLQMLQSYPESATIYTTDSVHSFSCLDLHDVCKTNWHGSEDEWKHVRLLLFAFGPTLSSHRHRDEILRQCVRLVVSEVRGQGSYHLDATESGHETLPDLQLSHSLSGIALPVTERLSGSSRAIVKSPMNKKSVFFRRELVPCAETVTAESRDEEIVVSSKAGTATSIYDDADMSLKYDVQNLKEPLRSNSDDDSYFSEDESSDDELHDLCGDSNRDSFSWVKNRASSSTVEIHFSGASQGSFKTPNTSASGTTGTSDEYSNTMHTDSRSESMPANVTANPSGLSLTTNPTKSTLERVFHNAKRKAEISDEKKDDMSCHGENMGARRYCVTGKEEFALRPVWASEVGLRIWTFCACFRDPSNPNDNYTKQVNDIFDEIEFPLVQKLVCLRVPKYGASYLVSDLDEEYATVPKKLMNLTFGEVANPKCRELMYRSCHFVGRYDFSRGNDILVKKESDRSTFVVRAYEWSFTTEQSTSAACPGITEANIWSLGEVPIEVGLTFKSAKRPVLIKFTKKPEVYESEIDCRIQACVRVGPGDDDDCGIIPIEQHFNAYAVDRKDDRMYALQIKDDRFKKLTLFHGECNGLEIDLSEFPYAIVYPDVYQDTLLSYLDRTDIDCRAARRVCLDVGGALIKLHRKGVVNPNLSLESVFACMKPEGSYHQHMFEWTLTDLSHGVRQNQKSRQLGVITATGRRHFSSAAYPPEMFVKLSGAELRAYQCYWDSVKRCLGVSVDQLAIAPKIDLETGEVFAVRCHYAGTISENLNPLPTLPYELVDASTTTDLWAYGLLLFQLCTGRPLLPYDARSGHLLDYNIIGKWTLDKAKAMVYEYVKDFIAQDVLIRLLAPENERKKECLQKILSHPFFEANVAQTSVLKAAIRIEEKRRVECATFQRRLQSKAVEHAEKHIVEERTIKVNCWDVKLLERIHLSMTQLMRRMLQSQPWRQPELLYPCAVIILPYAAVPRGSLKSTLRQKQIEAFGLELISLTKACVFVNSMKTAMASNVTTGTPSKWPLSGVLAQISLLPDEFSDIDYSLRQLGAKHIELFRQDPIAVGLKVVQEKIMRVMSCFNQGDAFLFLVDELTCLPVVNDVYPIQVSKVRLEGVLQNGLLLMYLCMRYSWGCSHGVDGLAKLICATANPGVPSSWDKAALGLDQTIDETQLRDEIELLQDALTEMYSSKHRLAVEDLNSMREYLYEVDPTRNFGHLQRVSVVDMHLWTSVAGACDIMQIADCTNTFEEMLRRLKGEASEAPLKANNSSATAAMNPNLNCSTQSSLWSVPLVATCVRPMEEEVDHLTDTPTSCGQSPS